MKRSNIIFVVLTFAVLESVNCNVNDHRRLGDRPDRSHNRHDDRHHGQHHEHGGRSGSHFQQDHKQIDDHHPGDTRHSNVRMTDRDHQNRNVNDNSRWYNGENRHNQGHHQSRHGSDHSQGHNEKSRQSHDHHHGIDSQQRHEGNRQSQSHQHPTDYSAYTEDSRHGQGRHQHSKTNNHNLDHHHTVPSGRDSGNQNGHHHTTSTDRNVRQEAKGKTGQTVNRTANLTQEVRDAALGEFKEIRFPLITAPQRVCPDGERRDRSNNCRAIF